MIFNSQTKPTLQMCYRFLIKLKKLTAGTDEFGGDRKSKFKFWLQKGTKLLGCHVKYSVYKLDFANRSSLISRG